MGRTAYWSEESSESWVSQLYDRMASLQFRMKIMPPRIAIPVPHSQNSAYAERALPQYALSLLLVALAIVLAKDRDFWFPPTPVTDVAEEEQAPPVTTQPSPAPTEVKPAAPVAKVSKHNAAAAKLAWETLN